ncbi:rhamnan synthesis F family protein [Ochrobactrum sp. Marseille-Q0166]|uniref:rhamnosyltransferase WsaF family glycosyltransferase n=1 Tax=Ochrobactrum sp. Marseille-Q0166 TaxID=2761105 RepID=UPI0016557B15|nr:rhamnan synthesis F family protein [Ochrobactrum sp. Marseille-Q0166]MBC8718497.1 hypothetical protein [Ochrobactrum sp. Marseille-Q0166]
MYYALRAYSIIKKRGVYSLILHSAKFIKYKLNLNKFSIFERNSLNSPAYINENGVLSARILSDDINPSVCIPIDNEKLDVKFDRVAVIAHIYYPDLTSEIIQYIANIPVPFGLFVTTDTDAKKAEIERKFLESGIDVIELEVRVTPNRGRDVAPKYIAHREVYARYEAFLHLHSKKSLHAHGLGSRWRKYLFENLVGSREIAASNLFLLSKRNIGIVYPEHFHEVKKDINWGYDFPIVSSLMSKLGLVLDVKTTLEFPSGSMFWGRSKAIRPILDMQLEFEDFPDEEGQIDGTLAHAIERALLLIAECTGHAWARVTLRPHYQGAPDPEEMRFVPLLGSERAPVGLISSSIGETLRILAAPQYEEKRRLNLMLHTVHPAAIFGGIDTALKIFAEMVASAGQDIDVRIIVSEALVSDVPEALRGYEVQKLGDERAAPYVIVDATDRNDQYLDVRPNDIFIATAWWTARNSYQLHDLQKYFFGYAPKIVYLIQDFEPGFYGWSTRYALAESTYMRGEDTVAIINSEELVNYLERKYHFPSKMVIRYKPNNKVDSMLSDFRREKIILFYSRPSALRNCFEAGIDALSLWARRNPIQANDWKIFCIGESFDSNLVKSIPNCVITGKMPLEEYAGLLSKASVGISLMVSPHPSYPPLEMAYAGIRTITNKYESKDLCERSEYITSIELPTPELIVEALQNEVNYAEKNMIGQFTSIKTLISDVKTDASTFDSKRVFEIIY